MRNQSLIVLRRLRTSFTSAYNHVEPVPTEEYDAVMRREVSGELDWML